MSIWGQVVIVIAGGIRLSRVNGGIHESIKTVIDTNRDRKGTSLLEEKVHAVKALQTGHAVYLIVIDHNVIQGQALILPGALEDRTHPKAPVRIGPNPIEIERQVMIVMTETEMIGTGNMVIDPVRVRAEETGTRMGQDRGRHRADIRTRTGTGEIAIAQGTRVPEPEEHRLHQDHSTHSCLQVVDTANSTRTIPSTQILPIESRGIETSLLAHLARV